MRLGTWWLALLMPGLAVAAATGACGSDDESGEGASGPGDLKVTGEPCTSNSECLGELCLDNETFASLSEGKEANIPGGYCSSLTCNDYPEHCEPNGFCFDLYPYTETVPLWACFDLCDSAADCRDGYECTNAEESGYYPPLPHKACLPPDLLCLLDVCEFCEGGCGTGGAGGGTGGSSTGGGSTGGGSTGGGSTGGAGGS